MTDCRRHHDRYAVSFPINFSGDAAGRGQATDLSVLGCAVIADHAAATDAYLKIILSIPDGESPLAIELAVVRWSHEQQFGVEFIAFGDTQKKRLLRFLDLAAHAARKGPHPK